MTSTFLPSPLPGLARCYLLALAGRNHNGSGSIQAQWDCQQWQYQLPDYLSLCGALSRTQLPTWLQVVSFPMQLAVLTAPAFPLAAMGLVHLENEISCFGELVAGSAVAFRCVSEPVQPQEKGQTVALVTEAKQGDALVWRSRAVYLQRQRKAGAHNQQRQGDSFAGYANQSAQWALPRRLGWRYGWLSGDLNPIHLHPWCARLFGFKSNIAHGMWSKARCLSELAAQGVLPDSPYRVAVRFAKPILLPAQIQCHWQPACEGLDFALLSADGTLCHLTGRVEPLSSAV
ncbi:MaoC/PaaZ C-terminal domain-containing protein [Alkalimonas delamerensis]|uniref:MaoC/PaaZ C-terminal domain-containing protein n=1 Tax=Alkalimonas delamerensis TaxID=265981 RepID=A0ABT9GS40_9GAMM|nr:MaoC/PaaZ C-terminal domain-containing protein [Alkalimonas delamerensis]MDP4529788.1 MaoC/PaaZ C-terminal domain-containing protein [Alkalimonas delamerensis]